MDNERLSKELRSDRFGTHRVLEPRGGLPQAAWRVDNDFSRVYDDELLLDVDRLNIDSASFVQMEGDERAGATAIDRVRKLVLETVAARGKQHNPVTGSGGMLLGRVAKLGASRQGEIELGARVATLVSLSLTPLKIDSLGEIDTARHQVTMTGQALLFGGGAYARMPDDLPEGTALSVFDVAGAAPQVARMVKPGMRVLVLGCGGKSGLLVSAAAKRAGATTIVGVERSEDAAKDARTLGACDRIVIADASDALAVMRAATDAGGGEFDFCVSCVNVVDAEMGAILSTRDGGTIYFFSMATSFTKAALGAEGVSRDVHMLVGNGYCPGHADETLKLLRENEKLRTIFVRRYG